MEQHKPELLKLKYKFPVGKLMGRYASHRIESLCITTWSGVVHVGDDFQLVVLSARSNFLPLLSEATLVSHFTV